MKENRVKHRKRGRPPLQPELLEARRELAEARRMLVHAERMENLCETKLIGLKDEAKDLQLEIQRLAKQNAMLAQDREDFRELWKKCQRECRVEPL